MGGGGEVGAAKHWTIYLYNLLFPLRRGVPLWDPVQALGCIFQFAMVNHQMMVRQHNTELLARLASNFF